MSRSIPLHDFTQPGKASTKAFYIAVTKEGQSEPRLGVIEMKAARACRIAGSHGRLCIVFLIIVACVSSTAQLTGGLCCLQHCRCSVQAGVRIGASFWEDQELTCGLDVRKVGSPRACGGLVVVAGTLAVMN